MKGITFEDVLVVVIIIVRHTSMQEIYISLQDVNSKSFKVFVI